jgi:hypothetical protein
MSRDGQYGGGYGTVSGNGGTGGPMGRSAPRKGGLAWPDSISPNFFAVTGKRSDRRNLPKERPSQEVGAWFQSPA